MYPGAYAGEVSLKIKFGYFERYKIKARYISPSDRYGDRDDILLEGRFPKVLARHMNRPLSSIIRIRNSEGRTIGKYSLKITITDHL